MSRKEDYMPFKETFMIKRFILYVWLDGELDQYHVSSLEDKVFDLIDKYMIKYLVFNFKELGFIDCSGIGLLLRCYNVLITKKVILCSMNEYIYKIITLCGLSKFFIIKKNNDEVINYLDMGKNC